MTMSYVVAVRQAVAAAVRACNNSGAVPLSDQDEACCRMIGLIANENHFHAVSFNLPHPGPGEPWQHPMMALPPDVEVPDSTRVQRSAWTAESLCHPTEAAIGPSDASEDPDFPRQWLRCCTLTRVGRSGRSVLISPCCGCVASVNRLFGEQEAGCFTITVLFLVQDLLEAQAVDQELDAGGWHMNLRDTHW
jgi:hypothetical protein